MKKFGLALSIVLFTTLVFGQIGSIGQNRRNVKLPTDDRLDTAVTQQDNSQEPTASAGDIVSTDTVTSPLAQDGREAATQNLDNNSKYTLVFSVPAGGQGVHYKG